MWWNPPHGTHPCLLNLAQLLCKNNVPLSNGVKAPIMSHDHLKKKITQTQLWYIKICKKKKKFNLESFLKNYIYFVIDRLDLFSELKVLK